MTTLTEDQLCRAFAEQIKGSHSFVTWLLGRTRKFNKLGANDVRLLWEEQQKQRTSSSALWWRHWWYGKCKCLGCEGGRETDIFVVFEFLESNERFALHIENKPPRARFTKGQAAAYSERARCWANQERFLNYSEYEVVLLAPAAFLDTAEEAVLFTGIPYEEITKQLPCFDANCFGRNAAF